jgi:hypothetical protein
MMAEAIACFQYFRNAYHDAHELPLLMAICKGPNWFFYRAMITSDLSSYVEKGYEPLHDFQSGAEYHVGFRLSIARDFKTVMTGLAVWKQILSLQAKESAKLNPNIINFNKLSRLMTLGSSVMAG